MKCTDFEQEIYLYSELTASEKEAVGEHIRQCAACQKLFVTMQGYQSVTSRLAENKSQPANHARLTSNIMQAIQSKSQEESTFVSLLQRSFVKYSFVTASLVLAVFFVTEQQHYSEPRRTVVTGVVTLKSATVSEVFEQGKKSKVSFYACIKTDGCGNAIIENLKQKNL